MVVIERAMSNQNRLTLNSKRKMFLEAPFYSTDRLLDRH